MPFLYKKGGKLPGQQSSTVAEAVTAARTSFPNSGPPGLGDPSGGVEYGGIPNRGAMMREIDAMMAPQSGFSAYNNPPASAGINPYGMGQEPQNYGPPGQMGHSIYDPYGSGGHLEGVPTVPDYYGVPGQMAHSVYEPEPVPGAGPGYYGQAPMSGSSHWIPENPMAPASTYGQLPGAGPTIYGAPNTASGDVLDPLGLGAGPSNQFSPLNTTVGEILDPVGVGAGPSEMYGPGANFGGPGSGVDGYGAGPGIYGQTPSQGEDNTPYNAIEGTPSIGDGMNQLGIGGYRTEDGQVGSTAPETAVANYEVEQKLTKDLADQRIAEFEARFGDMKAEEKERQEKYLEDLAKIQKKQRMFMVLGALSGDPNLARMAGMIAQQDMAVLDKKYAWASGDRTAQMQQSLMYNADGEYDPPESRQELYSALSTMGATSKEMDWFDGQFFGTARSPDTTYRNFTNTNTGQRYSGYGPPDESGAWAITGQYDYGTKDGKTPGGVDMEKYLIWQEAKQDNEAGGMSDEQLKDLEKALGFEQKDIKLNQEFSMFESIYKDSRFGWQLPGLKAGEFPTANEIEEQFAKFQKEVLPALKGAKKGGPADQPSKDEVVLVSTDAEFKKLKKGDKYRVEGDPEGKYRTKGDNS